MDSEKCMSFADWFKTGVGLYPPFAAFFSLYASPPSSSTASTTLAELNNYIFHVMHPPKKGLRDG